MRKYWQTILLLIGIYDFGVASLKYPLEDKFIPRMYHYSVSYTFNEWINCIINILTEIVSIVMFHLWNGSALMCEAH